ncbi:MAG: hypothetical protein ABI863_19585 [Ginsengibacter sp.]
MAENGKPWEIEQQQEFQHNILSVSFGSLSELSIVPDFWFAFSAGQALAVIHNFEFIHGDLHIEHIFFNSNDGTSTFIDFGAAEMGKITPEKCALDLVPAFLTMETKMFHGFLCGYINTAQVVLDYSYPNFTDQLQEVAGVNIENPVFLTESLTDVAVVLLKFGLELSSVDGKLSVSKGTNGTDENNSPEEIELFQQIMLVLLLADVNYNQLINLVREIAEERNTTNLSNELRSNFLGEDADPETQSSSVFGLIIKNILQEYRKKEPSNEQLIYVYGSIMKIINARFTPEDLESFIDILAGNFRLRCQTVA